MNPNWEAKDKESDKKTTTTNELTHYGDRKTIYLAGDFGRRVGYLGTYTCSPPRMNAQASTNHTT